MPIPASKSAQNRETGKHQVDEQRARILDAAEKLFLQNGLENTSMGDIATQAGITRVTLYRYFANRDEIAVEIHVRMLEKIRAVAPFNEQEPFSLEAHRRRAQIVIRSFDRLRDAYRYVGMFDKIYLDNAPDHALAQWTKAQLISAGLPLRPNPAEEPYQKELSVILNTITWFLEKLALRGELTWSDPSVPLEEDLRIFEEMVMGYFDRLSSAAAENSAPPAKPIA